MPLLASKVAELVAKLPATDRELTPDYKPAEGKPAPSSKFTAPSPEESRKLVDELLSGGKASLDELLSLVRDAGAKDFQDYKAEYMLHLVVLRAGDANQEPVRKLVAATLSSAAVAEATLPGVRPIVLRELQWVADGDSCATIAPLLLDPKVCDPASAVLRADGGEKAIAACRAAFPKAQGPCRLTILHALADLGDKESAATFRAALKDENSDLRLIAAKGLAKIGDAASASDLLKLATDSKGYERTKATSLSLQLAEKLSATGNKKAAAEIYGRLAREWTGAKEKHVREAAQKALAALEKST